MSKQPFVTFSKVKSHDKIYIRVSYKESSMIPKMKCLISAMIIAASMSVIAASMSVSAVYANVAKDNSFDFLVFAQIWDGGGISESVIQYLSRGTFDELELFI